MTQSIPIADIIIEKRRLHLREATLDALKASIKEIGLLFPPLVRKTSKGFKLVAGAHRVEAVRQLGWKTVPIEIECDKGDDEKWATLAEIDENLMRRTISKAERATIVSARYALTGHDLKPRFASETAARTGTSANEIRRDLKRAADLGKQTLNRIKGTSLDTGDEMDALARLPKSSRHRLISAAANGESVSAISGAKKNSLITAWARAGEDMRQDFLQHLRRIKVI